MLQGGSQRIGEDSVANLKSAVWMTAPLLGVVLVALVSRNLMQSEAYSWAFSGFAFLILAVIFISLIGKAALSYS
jgi:positive regulator of sigma E activity